MTLSDELVLRQLVLADYGLEVRAVKCIVRGLNIVYRLNLSGKYLYLKVYRPSGRSRVVIEHEHSLLAILEGIGEEGIKAALPLRSRLGGTVGDLSIAGSNRQYAVFENAEGRQPNFDRDDAYAIGHAVARLHRALRKVRGVSLPREATSTRIESSFLTLLNVQELSKDFKKELAVVRSKLLTELSDAADDKLQAIHGDVCKLNCRLGEKGITFFDFDECCLDSNLYDMAGFRVSAAGAIEAPGPLREIISEYVDGYQSVLHIDGDGILLLPHYSLVHWLRTISFLARNKMIPKEYWPTVEERSLATLYRIRQLTVTAAAPKDLRDST